MERENPSYAPPEIRDINMKRTSDQQLVSAPHLMQQINTPFPPLCHLVSTESLSPQLNLAEDILAKHQVIKIGESGTSFDREIASNG